MNSEEQSNMLRSLLGIAPGSNSAPQAAATQQQPPMGLFHAAPSAQQQRAQPAQGGASSTSQGASLLHLLRGGAATAPVTAQAAASPPKLPGSFLLDDDDDAAGTDDRSASTHGDNSPFRRGGAGGSSGARRGTASDLGGTVAEAANLDDVKRHGVKLDEEDDGTFTIDLAALPNAVPLPCTTLTKVSSATRSATSATVVAVNALFVAYAVNAKLVRILPRAQGSSNARGLLKSGSDAAIVDIQFCPGNANRVATIAADARLRVWSVRLSADGASVDTRQLYCVEPEDDDVARNYTLRRVVWHPTNEKVLFAAATLKAAPKDDDDDDDSEKSASAHSVLMQFSTAEFRARSVDSDDGVQAEANGVDDDDDDDDDEQGEKKTGDELVTMRRNVAKFTWQYDCAVHDVAVSCGGMLVGVARADGCVSLHHVANGELVTSFEAHGGAAVGRLLFVAMEAVVCTASHDGDQLCVWSTSTWKCEQTIALRGFPRGSALFTARWPLLFVGSTQNDTLLALHLAAAASEDEEAQVRRRSSKIDVECAKFDFVTPFTVNVPILSCANAVASAAQSDELISLYCVQPKAVQFFTVDKEVCVAPRRAFSSVVDFSAFGDQSGETSQNRSGEEAVQSISLLSTPKKVVRDGEEAELDDGLAAAAAAASAAAAAAAAETDAKKETVEETSTEKKKEKEEEVIDDDEEEDNDDEDDDDDERLDDGAELPVFAFDADAISSEANSDGDSGKKKKKKKDEKKKKEAAAAAAAATATSGASAADDLAAMRAEAAAKREREREEAMRLLKAKAEARKQQQKSKQKQPSSAKKAEVDASASAASAGAEKTAPPASDDAALAEAVAALPLSSSGKAPTSVRTNANVDGARLAAAPRLRASDLEVDDLLESNRDVDIPPLSSLQALMEEDDEEADAKSLFRLPSTRIEDAMVLVNARSRSQRGSGADAPEKKSTEAEAEAEAEAYGGKKKTRRSKKHKKEVAATPASDDTDAFDAGLLAAAAAVHSTPPPIVADDERGGWHVEDIERVLDARLSALETRLMSQQRVMEANAEAREAQLIAKLASLINKNIEKTVKESVKSTLMDAQFIDELAAATRETSDKAFRTYFSEVLIPGYEKATQMLFTQLSTTFESGLRTQFKEIVDAAKSVVSESASVSVAAAVPSRQAAVAAAVPASPYAPTSAAVGKQTPLMPSLLPTPAVDSVQHRAAALLRQGKTGEAFTEVLIAQDSGALEWLCAACDTKYVLSPTSPQLVPAVILTLVKALANDLRTQTSMKALWIRSALHALNVNDASLRPYLRPTLTEARHAVQQYIYRAHQERNIAVAAELEIIEQILQQLL